MRPSIVIRPAARVMRMVSPESADCAAAELGSAAAITAAASGPAIVCASSVLDERAPENGRHAEKS